MPTVGDDRVHRRRAGRRAGAIRAEAVIDTDAIAANTALLLARLRQAPTRTRS